MSQSKSNLAIALTLATAGITILSGMQTIASTTNLSTTDSSTQQETKAVDKSNKAAECKAFTNITDKAGGARNTMDLSVALRYINDLKQDLLALKVKDARLKSLQERYLQFAIDMGGKLEKVNREQAQGNYAALIQATPSLTAAGNKGNDLEKELLRYCK